MVFVHFQKISCVVLSLIPVAVGSLWMVGFMGLAGIPFNPANIMESAMEDYKTRKMLRENLDPEQVRGALNRIFDALPGAASAAARVAAA